MKNITEVASCPQPVEGLHVFSSTVDALTLRERVEKWLAEKGIQVFSIVDHAANAAAHDLVQAPATVVSFGNPAVGTPLMVECPLLALDLPLRVLVYEDGAQGTRLAYRDPGQLAVALGVAADHPSLKKMRGLLETLAQAVTQ